MGKPVNYFTEKNITGGFPLAAGALSVLLIGSVLLSATESWDRQLLQLLAPYITERRTRIMESITWFGTHRFLVPANLALIAILLLVKKKDQALAVAVTALSSLGLMLLLKDLFRRPRPLFPLVDGATNYGFPSGHALMSVAFYGLGIWLTVKNMRNKAGKITVIAALSLVIFLIGFSRLYLRVHFATDVLAGWAIGTCWLFLALALSERIYSRNSRKPVASGNQ